MLCGLCCCFDAMIHSLILVHSTTYMPMSKSPSITTRSCWPSSINQTHRDQASLASVFIQERKIQRHVEDFLFWSISQMGPTSCRERVCLARNAESSVVYEHLQCLVVLVPRDFQADALPSEPPGKSIFIVTLNSYKNSLTRTLFLFAFANAIRKLKLSEIK